jgi:hypothetical protein
MGLKIDGDAFFLPVAIPRWIQAVAATEFLGRVLGCGLGFGTALCGFGQSPLGRWGEIFGLSV